MSKIDLDKFVASLIGKQTGRDWVSFIDIKSTLAEQGLDYKDGEIVELPKYRTMYMCIKDWCSIDGTKVFCKGETYTNREEIERYIYPQQLREFFEPVRAAISATVTIEPSDNELIDAMMKERAEKSGTTRKEMRIYLQGLEDMYKRLQADMEEACKNADEVQYKKGYEQGKVDAMKDMPKWKRCIPSYYGHTDDCVLTEVISTIDNPVTYQRLRKGNYFIPITELEKLPKEG